MEPLVDEAVTSVVAAVTSGHLDVERLRDAARRVRTLRSLPGAVPDLAAATGPTLTDAELADVAGRAVRAEGDVALGPGPALLVELDPVPTIAVGRTPWGLAEPLTRARPGSRVARLGVDDDPGLVAACADGVDPRAVVVVTRDEPRHPWQSAHVRRLRSELPALVHVEMGVPGASSVDVRGRLWTHGASRASAAAAVQVLCGTADPGDDDGGPVPRGRPDGRGDRRAAGRCCAGVLEDGDRRRARGRRRPRPARAPGSSCSRRAGPATTRRCTPSTWSRSVSGCRAGWRRRRPSPRTARAPTCATCWSSR